MELIDKIQIRRDKKDAVIELLHGDLSSIPKEHKVDLLVVSAFPNSYTPSRGTLFEALYYKGFDMVEWAERKEVDLRYELHCWLSEPLPPELINKLNFSQILCFEPDYYTAPAQEVVGDVFRCINNFVLPDVLKETRDKRKQFNIKSVAMPMLATGNQQVPTEQMMPALLDAAIFWLKKGLPVDSLKIVIYEASQLKPAAEIFASFNAKVLNEIEPKGADLKINVPFTDLPEKIGALIKNEGLPYFLALLEKEADEEEKKVLRKLARKVKQSSRMVDNNNSKEVYDFFISYSHEHTKEVQHFVDALQVKHPGAKIFFDRNSIPNGGQWIRMISDAIENSGQFIAILSPYYSKSSVCWDEFQCAKLIEFNTKKAVIKAIRFYKEKPVPPIIGIYSYSDCMEGDVPKLVNAADTFELPS
jgi:hypothetical protein